MISFGTSDVAVSDLKWASEVAMDRKTSGQTRGTSNELSNKGGQFLTEVEPLSHFPPR